MRSVKSLGLASERTLAFAGRLEGIVRAARGWLRVGLALGAGALSVLALAPFFFWPIVFLTLPVLVWLIDEAGRGLVPWKRAAVSAWLFGFGYFLAGLFWVGEAFLVEADKFGWAMPFAIVLLPAGLALFWAAAAGVARLFWVEGVTRILVLAVAVSAAEWLRGHVLTGFPWNTFGYVLTAPDVLMQSAGLLGIYGLSLWAVIIFASPLVLAAERTGRLFVVGLLLAGLPLALLAGYGAARLSGPQPLVRDGLKVRLVQPAVPQKEKWKPENQGSIFRDHLAMSIAGPKGVAQGKEAGLLGISHVVWPEAAMPFLPLEHPEVLAAIGDMLPEGVELLSGGLRRTVDKDGTMRAFNSLMVFNDTGALSDRYDKTHLVPFGEYLPLAPVLERFGLQQLTRMRGGFSDGLEPRPLVALHGLPKVGVLICYEAIFPGVGRSFVSQPELLITVTNDGWFGNTTGPRQHFHQARVRAVEEGMQLIRVANNGISGSVDGLGRVMGLMDLDERGVLDVDVLSSIEPPLYARFGDWIFLGNVILILVGAGVFNVLRTRQWRNKIH